LTKHSGAFALGDRLMKALHFLQTTDVLSAQPGTIEIDGKQVYAMIQHYNTKPKESGFWEAHRKYIDVQYVAEGVELMGYVNLHQVKAGEYDASKDFLLAEGSGLSSIPSSESIAIARAAALNFARRRQSDADQLIP